MIEVVRLIQKAYTVNEIQEKAIQIGKRYTASCSDERLIFWLGWFFGSKIDFKQLEPYSPRNVVNELLTRYYPFERIIKYAFMQYKKKSGVLVFELPIGNSRVDISIFSKKSYAFEIKTEFDVLHRMEKQVFDYSKVFDYVSVVIPQKFLEQTMILIPETCGIILYSHEIGKLRTTFSEIRKPIKNEVNARLQLENLNKADLITIGKIDNHLHSTKKHLINEIIEKMPTDRISKAFKERVKSKYNAKWDFVMKNYKSISPIDFQAVYSTLTIDSGIEKSVHPRSSFNEKI